MAFLEKVTVEGMNRVFSVNPNCKRYTLRDNGFEETKAGNFQLIRSLDVIGLDKKNIRVKVVVSKDIKTLKISTTTSNGLNAVNLYKMKNNEMLIEKFVFILEGLVDRDVLIELV